MSCANEIEINGEKYVKASAVPKDSRCVVVVDRGWIFAGDVTEANGRIRITRALHVFRWESIGFDGMIKDPKSSKVTLKKLEHDVDLPADAEVFRVPVGDSWGL